MQILELLATRYIVEEFKMIFVYLASLNFPEILSEEMSFHAGKREVSNDTLSSEEVDDEFDVDLEDERDRRAIDEEDDEDFLQELDLLTRQMKSKYSSAGVRYDRTVVIVERVIAFEGTLALFVTVLLPQKCARQRNQKR